MALDALGQAKWNAEYTDIVYNQTVLKELLCERSYFKAPTPQIPPFSVVAAYRGVVLPTGLSTVDDSYSWQEVPIKNLRGSKSTHFDCLYKRTVRER